MYRFEAKMIAEPIAVPASTFSPKQRYASTLTTGNCTKPIGAINEASAPLSARVQHICALVPSRPARITQPQICGCGHCHTGKASGNDSGTHNSCVSSTMRSDGSVRERYLMLIVT